MNITMQKHKIKITIIALLISLWLLLGLLRTIYNISKLATEERSWYFLSTEQKKAKQFGELHYFFRFVQKNIPNGSNILFYTNNGMSFYLSRYYLYPTTLIWGERQFTQWGNDINRNFGYAIYFPLKKPMDSKIEKINGISYTKYKDFSYQNKIFGSTYKK